MKALIGKKAPEFHAPAVVNGNEIIEDFSLEQYVGKKYVVMFFYPMDSDRITCLPTKVTGIRKT